MINDLLEESLLADVRALLERAFAEDHAFEDLTTLACIPPHCQATARIVAKQEGVIAGLSFVPWILHHFDPALTTSLFVRDGASVHAGQILAEISGPAASLLSAERVTLNFVQQLSGVATLTARCVAAAAGTGCLILDTRKTILGLRSLQKYAVRMGGGNNQRMHLSDRILIKNNHLALALRDSPEPVAHCVRLSHERFPLQRVQVEIARPEELEIALSAGAASILLDNMSLDEIRLCVALNRGRAFLEASGGITLETLAAYARTGVNALSLGALTHSAPALDLAMRTS